MKRAADRIGKSWAAIVFFVFSVCLYGPVYIYLKNPEEFWFSLPMLMTAVLPVSLAVLLILLLLATVLPENRQHLFLKLFFGIALAMYLQGNCLNISYGNGLLDGREILWNRYRRYAVLDTLAWLACLAVPFIIDRLVKKKADRFYRMITRAALFLTIIQVPVFAYQMIAFRPVDNRDFKITRKDMFTLSEKENILVFVLDTMDERFYRNYAEEYPEFTEAMDGFVHYDNASSAGAYTIVAIPAMFTGTPYRKEALYSEYLHKVWSSPNVFSELHEAGYRVSVYGDTMEYSADATAYIDNFDEGRDTVGSYAVLTERIYRMDLFKFMPHLLKRYFWIAGSEFDDARAAQEDQAEIYRISDPVFYAEYGKQGFHTGSTQGKVFQLYHLYGAHAPYTMNENAEKEDATTLEQQVAGHFNKIREMMDDLKRKGLYENTTVLIVADHGQQHIGEYPVFLLKEAGAAGAYRTSDAPVSFFDLPPYLTALAGRSPLENEYSADLKSLREDDVRERHMFHNATGNSKVLIREYVSDGFAGDPDSWKMISQFEETGADLIEYELGTVLSFEVEATGNRYAVEGFGMNAGTRTLLYGPYAELRIPIGNLPSEGNLTVSIGFKNRKDDVHKRFTVMANGQTVYAGETDKTILKRGLDVAVPAASFKNGNVLDLKICFPDLDEAEMELDIEQRTYTVSLRSLCIR